MNRALGSTLALRLNGVWQDAEGYREFEFTKKKGVTTAERFDYLYSPKELKAWAPKLEELAGETKRLHVMFNNCYGDKAVRNAKQMASLIQD